LKPLELRRPSKLKVPKRTLNVYENTSKENSPYLSRGVLTSHGDSPLISHNSPARTMTRMPSIFRNYMTPATIKKEESGLNNQPITIDNKAPDIEDPNIEVQNIDIQAIVAELDSPALVPESKIIVKSSSIQNVE